MKDFEGFTSSETFTSIPDTFFRMLGQMEDIHELKVILYALWHIEHTEGAFRYITRAEILHDENFMCGITPIGVDAGLSLAVRRGVLLYLQISDQEYYFLNSPRGRASMTAIQKGHRPGPATNARFLREIPNVFKLYEENIGPLTPMIADTLKDAEQTYSSEWVADAIEQAVKLNVRNWKYIEAILHRWKEDGRAEKQNRRNPAESRGDSVTRKVEEFLKPRR